MIIAIRPNEKGLDGSDWIMITVIVSWFHPIPSWWWVLVSFQMAAGMASWGIYYYRQQEELKK
jgi:hypothetical protein